MHEILHALIHSVLILPFLFLAYLLMEWLEHKAGDRFKLALQEDRRTGPSVGALFGCIPFCGTSELGAGLYAGRVISPGTLVALFLSTSGEALLLAAGYPEKFLDMIFLILIKFVIAVICGFIVDLYLRNSLSDIQIHEICEEEHCHCAHENIFKSALKHTLPVFIMVVAFNLVIAIFEITGLLAAIGVVLQNIRILSVLLAALLGLLPGCAPLVLLIGLWSSGVLSSAALLAGLLTSASTGYIVLFKTNKNVEHNIMLTLFIFVVGILTGGFFELTGLLVQAGLG